MAKLNAAKRNALPTRDFAGPGRSYPIHDKDHARMALSEAAQHASPSERAKIRAAVHKRFPGIK